MAGDWIKWVKGLVRRREVLAIAGKLNIDCRIVASSAMLLWEWADDNTTDGHIGGISRGNIDVIADLPGFADALELVGWLRVTANGITIVNFEHHNGESAKARALGQKRKQRSRKRHESVTKMSRSHREKNATREEKRREETSSDAPPKPELACALVAAGVDDGVADSLALEYPPAEIYAAIALSGKAAKHGADNPGGIVVARLRDGTARKAAEKALATTSESTRRINASRWLQSCGESQASDLFKYVREHDPRFSGWSDKQLRDNPPKVLVDLVTDGLEKTSAA